MMMMIKGRDILTENWVNFEDNDDEDDDEQQLTPH